MNVNYSSWCWRTAAIGGRRKGVCPQTNTDKHEFPGRFNHIDHIDHIETGMKTWTLDYYLRGTPDEGRLHTGASTRGTIGEGNQGLRCESGVGVGRGACARPLSRSTQPYLGVSRSVSPFSDLFFQGCLRTATMGARGGIWAAFGRPQGGQAMNFGRVGSPKCLLMLPCARLYRLFFESFIGGACARPLYGAERGTPGSLRTATRHPAYSGATYGEAWGVGGFYGALGRTAVFRRRKLLST
ncbi:MAG: hypothetical protein JWR26_4638 [Pedosphaera sp.]|nr:hypothetical protein [Pedosphaera sp.]